MDAHVSPPVNTHITGQPTLDQAIEDEALHTARVATLLALPILFLALLLVLRAPLAALITTAFGGVTAFVGFGVMTLVAKQFEIDAIGVALASVMGLALGTGLFASLFLASVIGSTKNLQSIGTASQSTPCSPWARPWS